MATDKKYSKKSSILGVFKKSSENAYSNAPSEKPAKKLTIRSNVRTSPVEKKDTAASEKKEITANPNSIILSINEPKESEYAITRRASEAQSMASGLELSLDANNEDLKNLKLSKASKLFKKKTPGKEEVLEQEVVEEIASSVSEDTPLADVEVNSLSNEIESGVIKLENPTGEEAESYLLLSSSDNNTSKKQNRIKHTANPNEIRVGTLEEISNEEKAPKEKWKWNVSLGATSTAMTFGVLLLTLGFFFTFGLIVGRGLSPEATAVPLASIVPDNENVIIENNAETLKPEELEYAKVLKTVPVTPNVPDPNKVYLDAEQKPLPAGNYIIGPDGNLLPDTTIILGQDGKPIPVSTITLNEEGKAISQNLLAVEETVPYPIGKAEVVTPTAEEEPKNIIEPVEVEPEEPKLYDYVLRAASFKDEKLADNLRASLEGDGLRTQLVKSGSWYMVEIKYRGTEENFVKIKSGLKKHRISDTVTVSKVEVVQAS